MLYHYDAPSLGSSHLLRVKFVTTNYMTQWNSHRWRFSIHSKIIPYIGKNVPVQILENIQLG